MILDENEPAKKSDYTLGEKLDDYSVDDLQELKTRLEEEIARVDSEMGKKKASRDAAASVFKS